MPVPRLVKTVEAWDFSNEELEGKFAFTSIWENDRDYYLYRHYETKPCSRGCGFPEGRSHPKRLLSSQASLRVADVSLQTNPPASMYLKKIEPYVYDPEQTLSTQVPADDLLHEAQVCDELARSPHPNICRYLGYLPTADGQASISWACVSSAMR
ncbi:hypothetical protein C8R43DRAFT_1169039 [Mycena crocata]|nr:hypothetical protein C8R43DRAFT_1169039 [Mycena crocata]